LQQRQYSTRVLVRAATAAAPAADNLIKFVRRQQKLRRRQLLRMITAFPFPISFLTEARRQRE